MKPHNPQICGHPDTDCDACRKRYREFYKQDRRSKERIRAEEATRRLEKATGLTVNQIAECLQRRRQ